jgi:heme/copper-type cytochrome/quinol oxidase subunit 2
LRHIDGRRRYTVLAALPLLLASHQFIEAFVWWGLQGHVPAALGHLATWICLVIAFVVLPVYVPVAIFLLETKGLRRRA